MLSNDQLVEIERIYFVKHYLPKINGHLEGEGIVAPPFADGDEKIAELHLSLGRASIFSPRNTFRFIRFSALSSRLGDADEAYFRSIVFKQSLDEDHRFDLLEKNILKQDNKNRWGDLR